MTADTTAPPGPAGPASAAGPASPAGPASSAVTAMLEARSVALVGASARPGSLGARMIEEMARSPSRPRTYLVNPRYPDIGGVPCLPSLAEVPEPVDLVLLAVPDAALEDQLVLCARTKARSAVIFGNAVGADGTTGLRDRLAVIATQADLAVCGAGCMGFVNVARGLRAVGYLEPDPVPAGPVALITHSGSVFSTLLRARRGFGFSVAVSSGQELVTPAAGYARYALGLAETRVLALVLEAIRDAAGLRAALETALETDVPVVLLSVGLSPAGKNLVSAHSGALAAADGAWEALAGAYGVHRVRDLAELADTLELFTAGRRCQAGTGIATVHDSGLERAHVADLAAELGVPFAPIGPATAARLGQAIDPGLEPGNPLDVWGTGRDTEPLFAECLSALAADPEVAAVALAVDLVPEFDGDEAYPRAMLTVASGTAKPVAVLAGLPGAVDLVAAARLRAAGVPVLEGTRSGLLALRHLLDHAARPEPQRAAGPGPGGSAGRRCSPPRAARSCSTCCATTASRPCAPGPPIPAPRPSRRPPRSATRSCSRPTSRASRTNPTSGECGSAWPARCGRRRLRRPGRPARPARAGVRDGRARHRAGPGPGPRRRPRPAAGHQRRWRPDRDFCRTVRGAPSRHPLERPRGACRAPAVRRTGRSPRPGSRRPRRHRRRHHRPVPTRL